MPVVEMVKMFDKSFKSEKPCSMHVKPSCCISTLQLNKKPSSIKL